MMRPLNQPTMIDPDAIEASRLMERYCGGEVAAFHRLYALVAPRIFSYLCALIGDRPSAEDLLQHTFLKLHEARSSYVRNANPIPWIYTIARHTCFDELRGRQRSRARLTLYRRLHPPSAADITGAAEDTRPTTDVARVSAAMAVLKRLPETQRRALIMTKIHGRSQAAAARVVGSSQGAIKLRVHRAYVTIRSIAATKE